MKSKLPARLRQATPSLSALLHSTSPSVAAAMFPPLPADPAAAAEGGALKAPGLDSYHVRNFAPREGLFAQPSLLETGCAQHFLAGGVRTLTRLAAADYDMAGISAVCPLCGLHPDTVADRPAFRLHFHRRPSQEVA